MGYVEYYWYAKILSYSQQRFSKDKYRETYAFLLVKCIRRYV